MDKDLMLLFVEVLGNSPVVRIMDYLLHTRNEEHTMANIIQGARVAYPVLRHVLGLFGKHNLITEIKNIGKRKKYRLNEDSPAVQYLIGFNSSIGGTLLQEQSPPVGKTEVRPDPDSYKGIM